MLSLYPDSPAERDRWILARRPDRAPAPLDPHRPWAFFVEDEYSKEGERVPIATLFLTNRECPWRCLMCDLWKNTLTETVPVGAIPAQIDYALTRLPAARQIKLYNSGSFFDPRAIPAEDFAAIAERVKSFERVIVENHPSLTVESCLRFRDMLQAPLEIAMGLETVHPEILPKLNKRMTLAQFSTAADFLRNNGMDLRVFVLVKPPFMAEEEAVEWAARSVDFAFDCGATAVTLIPTRGFSLPRLNSLEDAFEYGLNLRRGRVFVDLWDVNAAAACQFCRNDRTERMRHMNLTQELRPPISCTGCQ